MNRKPVFTPAPFTPDDFFRLFGKMFEGMSVPGSMPGMLGTAREPWAEIKGKLHLHGWPSAEESEAAARKVFENMEASIALDVRNDLAKTLNKWLSSFDGKPTINDFERLILDLQSPKMRDDPRIIEQRKLDGLCAHGYGFVEYCPDCKDLAFNNLINSAEIAAEMWNSNSAALDPEEIHAMLVDALTAARKFRGEK